MVELLRYLEANGFTTYIASGGDRDFMRPFAEQLYGIPPERVIGSALGLDFDAADDGTDLLYKSKIEFFDDGPEKPVRIWSRIGRRPLVAGGNSNGDVPMLRFAGTPSDRHCGSSSSTTTVIGSSTTSPGPRTPSSGPRRRDMDGRQRQGRLVSGVPRPMTTAVSLGRSETPAPGTAAQPSMPTRRPPTAPPGFHVLAKPSGPICNLDCQYCYFLEKEALYPGDRFRMSD